MPPKLSTWSTWDVRCLNALLKVPEMVEVRLMPFDSKSRQMIEEMRWESLVKLGPHAADGSYFEITLKAWNNTFEIAGCAEGDQFTLKITPLEVAPTFRLFAAALFRWNAPGSITHQPPPQPSPIEKSAMGEGAIAITPHATRNTFHISPLASLDLTTPLNTTHPGFLLDASQTCYLRGNHERSAAEMDALLAEKKAAWLATSVRGEGWLAEAPEAAFAGMIWNTIYEPIGRRICTPVTREWCIIKPERPWFGSYVIFVWDTFLASLLTALQDEQLAYTQIESVLAWMDGSPARDHLPLLTSEVNTYAERSQPPVGAYCVLKLYRQFGDISLLENTFERLLTWHGWWMKHRDGNGDGLLEWGTDLQWYGEQHLPFYLNECRSESGLDNSPMYDGTRYNPHTHTLEIADVGLNSLYALDAWALAEITAILQSHLSHEGHKGKTSRNFVSFESFVVKNPPLVEIEASLRAEYQQLKERINNLLWNDALGIYCNRYWDGRLDETLSPTSFYPLLAGVASPAQARRMVEEHLLNPAEFWGEYVIPTTARNHPAFADNDYWRGRIWAPTNFLVGEGLKRYGFDDVAHAFARKSLNLFMGEWRAESHIHENYNTLSGDGDDVANADPVYTWGGLLAYMGVCELAEAQPWGGLRFGNLEGTAGAVCNLRFTDGVYTIRMEGGLRVERDGTLLLTSDCPVLITEYHLTRNTLSLHIRARQPAILDIFPPPGIQTVIVNNLAHPAQTHLRIPIP